MEKLTHLPERRAAFQRPSAAKPLLVQAFKYAWDYDDTDQPVDAFQLVLQMETASPEDRFFAYYGLIMYCDLEYGYDDQIPSLLAQYEAEALTMPETHRVHKEVALLKASGYI